MAANTRILFVGVGGTGTKIVRSILDKWEQQLGRPPRHVTVASIDAHSGSPEGGRLRHVAFSGSEKIDYPAEHARLLEIPDSQLEDWWPQRVFPEARVGFHDGCGAKRSNGRFWAMSQAERIVGAIERALDRLTAAGSVGLTGQAGEIDWEAYVCCSLGNGTGGGAFMSVGAMVKDILKRRGVKNPKVTGVFIPGSVTRWGSGGRGEEAMQHQVAASGFASLVELQHEFYRDSAARDDELSMPKPDKPFEVKGWTNGYWHSFRPSYGIPAGSDGAIRESPFDFALILDRETADGYTNTYDALFDGAAEALKSLLGGADQDSRMLDLEIKCKEGRRFGSLGAKSLVAPTSALTAWAARRQVEQAFRHAVDERIDTATDLHLLADQVPGGLRLGAEQLAKLDDAGEALRASVDFFIDHVLEVKESGDSNDLFDGFEAVSASLSQDFSRALEGLQTADRKQVSRQAEAVVSNLLKVAKGEGERFEKDLARTWGRAPSRVASYDRLEDLGEAGPQWLLEFRLAKFVDAGLPGLGVTWLDELERQLQANLQSVYDQEVREHLGGQDQIAAELDTRGLQQVRDELKKASESVFASFQSAKIEDLAGQVAARAAQDFGTALWRAKVRAVVGHYEKLLEHVGIQKAGLRKVLDQVRRSQLDELARQTAELHRALERKGGSSMEVRVGTSDSVLAAMIAGLDKDPATRSRGLIGKAPGALWLAYGAALGTDGVRRSIAVPARAHAAGAAAEDLVRLDLDETLRTLPHKVIEASEDALRAGVGRSADVEALLVEEARVRITAYYDDFYSRKGQALGSEAQAARDALQESVPAVGGFLGNIEDELELVYRGERTLSEALSRRETVNGEEREVGAIQHYLRGQVFALIEAAEPMWRPVVQSTLASVIQRKMFFTFSRSATRIKLAVSDLKEAMGRDLSVKDQSDDFFPPSRLECVSIQIGADLDMIAPESEIHSYRLAMANMPDVPAEEPYSTWFAGVNPHSERKYQDVGLKWLENKDQETKGNKLGKAEGEFLMALGSLVVPSRPERFRYLERKGSLHYTVRQLGTLYSDGMNIGPKGMRYFADWLEGKDRPGGNDGESGQKLANFLKEACWEDLRFWIRGDEIEGVPGAGLARVCEDLISQGLALEKAGRTEETMANMGSSLKLLAAELEKSGGERPNFLKV